MQKIELRKDNGEPDMYFIPPAPTPLTKFGLQRNALISLLILMFIGVYLLIIGNLPTVMSLGVFMAVFIGLNLPIVETRHLTVLQFFIKKNRWNHVKGGHVLFKIGNEVILPIYKLEIEE